LPEAIDRGNAKMAPAAEAAYAALPSVNPADFTQAGIAAKNNAIRSASQAQLSKQRLAEHSAVEGIMRRGISDPGERYGALAQVLAPINLKDSIEASKLSLNYRKEQREGAHMALEDSQKSRADQLAILGSLTPQTYRMGMEQYQNAGGKLPRWYTGDWNKDAPYVEQMAQSGMTAFQQAELVGKMSSMRLDQAKFKEEMFMHNLDAMKAEAQAKRYGEAGTNLEDFRKDESLRRAREQSANQAGVNARKQLIEPKNALPVVHALMLGHPEFDSLAIGDDKGRPGPLVSLVMSRAIEQMAKPGEKRDFEDVVREQIALAAANQGAKPGLWDKFASWVSGNPAPSAAIAPNKSGIQPTEKPPVPTKTVSSKAEYDALPSGSEFVDANGKKWKKP